MVRAMLEERFALRVHNEQRERAVYALTVAARDGTLDAIVLTGAHPDRSGGAEALALRLDVPVLAPPDAARGLPHPIEPYTDAAAIPYGDTPVPLPG